MTRQAIIDWLLEGDLSIQYQCYRDLLGSIRPDLQVGILENGWGKAFLEKRNSNGHWGRDFYQPKWISSHYTLLDLRNLNPVSDHPLIQETITMIAQEYKAEDGGVNPGKTILQSDVCVNGMFVNYAAYFGADSQDLNSIIDFLIGQIMPDGGFNCRSNRSGAVHSSLHSTLSVLEGIQCYLEKGYSYRAQELKKIEQTAQEFILIHQLFKSDRTGEIIHKDFLKLPYPSRWRYDILRAMDYFRLFGMPWDARMEAAWQVILQKRRKDGRWNVQSKHPGQIHFEMEKAGQASRWNTFRVLRIAKHFGKEVELF